MMVAGPILFGLNQSAYNSGGLYELKASGSETQHLIPALGLNQEQSKADPGPLVRCPSLA